MQISNLPDELVAIIIGHLDHQNLRAARLVNRAWCRVTTKALFHVLIMMPTTQGIENWEAIVNSDDLSQIPQHVVINSSPLPDYVSWNANLEEDEHAAQLLSEWLPYQCRGCRAATDLRKCNHGSATSHYRSFYNSFYDLAQLPHVQKVSINFNQECATEDYMSRIKGFESPQCRDDQLFRLFRALRERLEHPGRSVVKTLSIRNLQNVAFYPDTWDQFQYAVNTIEHLQLLITEECNHFDGADSFWFPETRLGFMTHLRNIWLTPLSSHLKSLDLSFHFYWGALPSRFHGSDLDFPQLDHISLEKYCLSHDKSMDWILRQRSLKHLHLRNCAITVYFRFSPDYIEECQVDLADWTQWRDALLHWPTSEVNLNFYNYQTTWEYFLNRIRVDLSQLTRFNFVFTKHDQSYMPQPTYHTNLRDYTMPQYIAFNADSTFPGPWIKPSCHDFRGLKTCDHCDICTKTSSVRDKDNESLTKLLDDISTRLRCAL